MDVLRDLVLPRGWLLVPDELRRTVDCLTGNFTICPPALQLSELGTYVVLISDDVLNMVFLTDYWKNDRVFNSGAGAGVPRCVLGQDVLDSAVKSRLQTVRKGTNLLDHPPSPPPAHPSQLNIYHALGQRRMGRRVTLHTQLITRHANLPFYGLPALPLLPFPITQVNPPFPETHRPR